MKHQRSALTRLLHFLLTAIGVMLLAGCAATPFAFRGSSKVAALRENDIAEVALVQAGRFKTITDREDIRRLLNPQIYVRDSLPGAEVATGYETVVVTFLAKPGKIPAGQSWATRENLSNSWKEWDNRESVEIYHAPAFAELFHELMP